MSKSIAVVFIFLIIIIAGFSYFNYNQLNQLQKDLLEKETRLAESGRLIKEQETSLTQMEEKIKEVSQKIELPTQETKTEINRDDELTKQLEAYRNEVQLLQSKTEQLLQKNESDIEEINQMREEKARLESLFSEREKQWKEKEEENRGVILSLQDNIQQYEGEKEEINKKLVTIGQYLDAEQSKREDLEKKMVDYEKTIEHLKQQLSLKQDEEKYVQQISQLQSNKKKLEEEIAQKDINLYQTQKEYQSLKGQLAEYEFRINRLQEEISAVHGQKETIENIKTQLAFLEEEKIKLESSLREKETRWLEEEQLSKETITQLQKEISGYESNIKEIGSELLALKEDLAREKSLKEIAREEIESFSTQIDELKREVSHYKDLEKEFQSTFQKLLSEKGLLEQELAKKGETIDQKEYNELLDQISLYRTDIEKLTEDLSIARKREDSLYKQQLADIEREKDSLVKMVGDSEREWVKQNEENRLLIHSLENQLAEYKAEIKSSNIDSSLLKEEISLQETLYQQSIDQIKEKEDQISLLVAEITQYMKKIENYEKTVAEFRIKLEQLEESNFQEQRDLMETIHSLIAEREEQQNKISQCGNQVNQFQAEIAELQNKIALLEKGSEPGYYEVKSGDCLWTIAREKYSEGVAWIKIFKANQGLIENPNLIFPYQQFVLPE
jgi:chromosome segregation ATPase